VPTRHDSIISNLSSLLTKRELARLLNVHPRTINASMAARRIPFVRVGPRMVRYDKHAIERALARNITKEIA
jgi:excisionase family DNA binding protein